MKLLLLHAFPLDSRMWEPQLEAFRAHEVVAPDLYGRGRTMDAWAESLLAEVDGDLVVVGASIGGYCALAMARLAAQRMRGLVLAGSRAEADTPERREARAASIELVEREGVTRLFDQLRPQLFSADAPAAVLDLARASALEQDPASLVGALEVMRDRRDSSAVVSSFESPLLVAVGERDPFLPLEDARALAASAPQGLLEVFAGAGHLPSLEQPDRFNAVLTDFLSGYEA